MKSLKDVELYDFTDIDQVTKEDLKTTLLKIEDQKKDLVTAFTRNIFGVLANKNAIVHYKHEDGTVEDICLISRGTVFYVYSPLSPYVKPDEYPFNKFVDEISSHISQLETIQGYEIVSDEEAIEFIRAMYTERARESKILLSKIMRQDFLSEANTDKTELPDNQ